MHSACIYLIKEAVEEAMSGLKDLGQATAVFPDETAEGRRARLTLMDLGEKGTTMPRAAVQKYLTENAPKYTPMAEWLGRGAGLGAAAGMALKYKDLMPLLKLRAEGRQFTAGNKQQLSGILGSMLGFSAAGAGMGAYLRHRSQKRTGEKAVDEYNQLQLKKLYK